MLACLPGPGDLSLQLLPHTQMNTGLQKWDTTQRMRSAQFPTPAELDAFAKKVSHLQPLCIKIFPNSVKVPQRNHVRRTVNGLDTSGATQQQHSPRYSPYPPAAQSAKAGLLAVVKVNPTVKGVLKDFDGTRQHRPPHSAAAEVIMTNHALTAPSYHGGAPSSSSTLSLNVQQRPPQPQTQTPQPHTLHMLPQGLRQPPPPMAPQQHPPQGPPLRPPQTLSQPPPQGGLPNAAVMIQQQQQQQQQPLPPRTLPDVSDAPPNVTVSTSTIPLSMGLHHRGQPPGHHQADLSAIVHQINRFCAARALQGAEGQVANPSPISRNLLISACSRVSVHAAGGGPPEKACALPGGGPHPQHHHPPPPPPCMASTMHRLSNNATAYHQHNDIKQHQHLQQHLHQQHQNQHQHHQQQHQHNNTQQQQQTQNTCSWNQHPLAHLQQQQHHVQNGGTCTQPCSGRDPPGGCYACKGTVGYHPHHHHHHPHHHLVGQPYPPLLKPPVDTPTPPSPPPPVVVVSHNGSVPTMAHHHHYANNNNNHNNGHYFQPHVWNILPTPHSDNSCGSQQDLACMPFHCGGGGGGPTSTNTTSIDCGPSGGGGPHYRLVATGSTSTSSSSNSSSGLQTNLMQGADYLGAAAVDFQTPSYFRDQNLAALMGKMHRLPTSSRAGPEVGGEHGRVALLQHPGY